ncbi:MAG TPA: ABC transporter ATP-binding protein, partial [Candidatus Spyradosoma merdigallinarum]|nr:ABC transporter ATP-binding protein [Candidatus Spyradosoma merdigallinarum]
KKKLSYKETREHEAIPQKIDALEAEQKALAEKLNDPDFCRDPAAAKAAAARLDAIEEELMRTLERWEALEARK